MTVRGLKSDWLQRSVQSLRQRLMLNRRDAYVAVFGPAGGRNQAQEAVLGDLARFCRAQRSCFHEDPRAHALAEGRREVWLRIQQTLNLTDDQVATLVEMDDDDGD